MATSRARRSAERSSKLRVSNLSTEILTDDSHLSLRAWNVPGKGPNPSSHPARCGRIDAVDGRSPGSPGAAFPGLPSGSLTTGSPLTVAGAATALNRVPFSSPYEEPRFYKLKTVN